MIKIKKLSELTKNEKFKLFNRFGDDFSKILNETVIPIVKDVINNGDNAVIKYTEKFDGVKLDKIIAGTDEIESGYKKIDKKIISAFSQAKKNIEEFHLKQLKTNMEYSRNDGTRLGIMHHPIESAGIYVPGGKASYPSSILMGVIPAKIAGVEHITVITPPDKEGNIPDIICAVCKIAGVTSIIKSGGAQGIAAAGFGTETVKKVNIIVGPGNIFVTAAKTFLFSQGLIQIDSMAGPSEVLIAADESANPKWTAFDLLSQAEHDEMAESILVTSSVSLAEAVRDEIEKDLISGAGRSSIKKKSISDNGLILIVKDIEEAISFSNNYAPEHMQLLVDDPFKYLDKIKNVGSLFLGHMSPVAVGDYYSGTNHILPTGGSTRFSSGTSVDTFMRRTTYQYLTKDALSKAREFINIMSEVEGFNDKHGGSVNVRFEND